MAKIVCVDDESIILRQTIEQCRQLSQVDDVIGFQRAESTLEWFNDNTADIIGMYEAFGFYKAEWFLRFMGIIGGSGGRLIFYTKELPEKVRKAVAELAAQTAYALEKWSQTDGFKAMTTGERIKYMCKAGFEGMIHLKEN